MDIVVQSSMAGPLHNGRRRRLVVEGRISPPCGHESCHDRLIVARAQNDASDVVKGSQLRNRGIKASSWAQDPFYQKIDVAAPLRYKARQGFVREVCAGEHAMRVGRAALFIAAEDDAAVSNSAVPLPVEPYLARLDRMASDAAALLRSAKSDGPEAAVGVVSRYLFETMRFNVPFDGASALPNASIVDHPGAWEKSSWSYVNEVLTKRVGSPAALSVILGDVMHTLLADRHVDFAVRIETASLSSLPRASVLPGISREALVIPGTDDIMNTSSASLLVALLRGLKRPFWPFRWAAGAGDIEQEAGSHGGFQGAALAALEGESDATSEAISRFAKYRLERGIFTSTEAGDIRRALLASERLVLLEHLAGPLERRDYAVLLMHVGRLGEARAEMRTFMRSAGWDMQSPREKHLCECLWGVLEEVDAEEPPEPLSLARELKMTEPDVTVLDEAIPW